LHCFVYFGDILIKRLWSPFWDFFTVEQDFPAFPSQKESDLTKNADPESDLKYRVPLAVKFYQFRITGVTGMSIAC
jgi:hypothetical protein